MVVIEIRKNEGKMQKKNYKNKSKIENKNKKKKKNRILLKKELDDKII